MPIGVGTRLVALLGDPVDHSLSPRFQNAAFRAAGVDAVYLALRCDGPGLGPLLRGVAAAGGAGNVTLPHKTRAAAVVDERTPAVERTGACNTFWIEDGRIHGDNTDVEGFDRAARQLIGSPAGARVLVLGAGGAARAVVLALIDARADGIHLLNRTPGRARALREALDPAGRRVAVLDDPDQLRREGYDLVVNATPLGLDSGDPPPVDLGQPARVGAVLDLTYRAGGTDWVRSARRHDIPAADGLEMLIQQGAASFRRWFPGREPPLDAMRGSMIDNR
ncbi:MAG: shikimate dehydrogenase [Gemmatimonadetes bacterium]|nr:shikimate dehydrogenase [Gemmatimonadota bacterium]NIQ60175.1 shikimate dehydrogenase [Gemmatimonadota bacterium]NIU80392.1 shikimate dehydrogenase [Gammaproteobacteria bacterium]NIX48735.1 shikimate dehydrogenase [Gemmatimonadota bacterium]NIY13193.1 shikimate dehydrogenase [Gemmatimonadota bacterium]